jgi:hypothetical protein
VIARLRATVFALPMSWSADRCKASIRKGMSPVRRERRAGSIMLSCLDAPIGARRADAKG